MVFEAITKALTTVKDTVKDIRKETEAALEATVALDKGVTRVVNTATEEASSIGAAATKFMDGLNALGGQPEIKDSAPILAKREPVQNNLSAAAAKFVNGLKGLGEQAEIPQSAAISAPEMAAQIKQERVGMFAKEPMGPANGRGATDWRDRFAKPGYQVEAETAPTASPSP